MSVKLVTGSKGGVRYVTNRGDKLRIKPDSSGIRKKITVYIKYTDVKQR